MSHEALAPLVRAYHSGTSTGATEFFTDNPAMLAWVREEMERLKNVPERGSPSQPDFVSAVHLKAYQKMVAEFEGKQQTV